MLFSVAGVGPMVGVVSRGGAKKGGWAEARGCGNGVGQANLARRGMV